MQYAIMTGTLALLMSTTVHQQADDQAVVPSLSDPETEVLNLEEDANRRMTLPVRIEGAGPFNFMVDTGSQATAITHEIDEQLGLRPAGTATLIGMISRKQVNLVELDGLEVGSRVIDGLTAPVLDRRNVGADGIIGLDSLQDMRVLIDFRHETIAVADATRKKSSYGFEIVVSARRRDGQLLITDARVEGVKATVIIDTGAQATIGNYALRDKIRKRRKEIDVVTKDVNGATLTAPLTIARNIRIQGLELRNLPITYAESPAFEALGMTDYPVLSLGMQDLRAFDRIAIDFSKRRVLFDLPSKNRLNFEFSASRL